MSQKEMVIKAAASLPEIGFSAEDLVVASWRMDISLFGLQGYADLYPDSNKVLACLMGERGLVRAGLLEKIGAKKYKLTQASRKLVSPEVPLPLGKKVLLEVWQVSLLDNIFKSSAVQAYGDGRWVTFTVALSFLKLASPNSMRSALSQILTKLNDNDFVVLPNGRQVEIADVQMLQRLDEGLRTRYARELKKEEEATHA